MKQIDQSDPIRQLVGKIVIAETFERTFAARLISFNNNEVWFENKSGLQFMHQRDQLLCVYPGKQV